MLIKLLLIRKLLLCVNTYEAFVIKPFKILSPVLISISHENTIVTSLTATKCHLAKFCKVDAWSQALLFTGEVFLVQFVSFNP